VTASVVKSASCAPEEFLIAVIAPLLEGAGHVAVGALSPIPGCAALLARERSQGRTRVSIIHGDANNPFTDGGRELFDCAGQGRIDVFFLGGAQIDGQANINLVGAGRYPKPDKRFPGSFGSALMYFVVPRVILFAPEHSPRVLVDKVDFISAPGTSPPEVRRTGGPKALVTGLCIMAFDRGRKRFRLQSVHPGHTVEEVRAETGFDFDVPDRVPETPGPDAIQLKLLRSTIAGEIAQTYPAFAERVFGRIKSA
jgi:glutaconate CoA-transferase subunit B